MWTYKIESIDAPSLILIRVRFSLYNDSRLHVTEDLDFTPEKLKSKNRKEIIDTKINDRIKQYVYVSQIAEDLKSSFDKDETKEVESEGEDEVDNSDIKDTLKSINKVNNVLGSFILDNKGKVLVEEWNGSALNLDNIKLSILNLFKNFKNETNNTNQGQLNHLLLETDKGTLVLAAKGNKVLCIHSKGTGEVFSGQILRTLSELEDPGE